MFYRILLAPPGYADDQKYMVGKYSTIEFGSCGGNVLNDNGSRFFATLDEARKAIPKKTTQLPFDPERQFVELWQTMDDGA